MNQPIYVCLFLSLALLTACNQSLNPADVEYDHSLSPYHIVKRGESISSIAQQYHMDKRELIRLNGLKAPYYIMIGQRLLIRPLAATAKIQQSVNSLEPEGPDSLSSEDVHVNSLPPLNGTNEEALEPDSAGLSPAKDMPEAETTEIGRAYVEEDSSKVEGDRQESSQEIKKTTDTPVIPNSENNYGWPVKGRIIRSFKAGKNGNDGINISAPEGTPVAATNNGVVAHAANQLPGFGNVVLIKHDKGIMSVYAHLNSVSVKTRDTVKKGQEIGRVGKTGNIKEPQLHFEIRNGTKPVDPSHYLR